MKNRLLFQALAKFLAGVVLVGALLFIPAGSLRYPHGWVLMLLLFIPMFCAGCVMMVKNPQLLRERLDAREQEGEQKRVVALSGLLFIGVFVFSGLNWRFQWHLLPDWCCLIAAVVFVGSYLLYAEVLRENTYLSRTIKVQDNQRVIDTGLYGIVRHPMYTATTILFLSMPLVLGSVVAFLAMLLYIPLIIRRIKNEEAVLAEELEGYREYMQKVRYRLIPFIW